MYHKEFLNKIFAYYTNNITRFNNDMYESLVQASIAIYEQNLYKKTWTRNNNSNFSNYYPMLTNELLDMIELEEPIINYLDIGAGDGKVMYLNCLELIKKFNKPVIVNNVDINDYVLPFIHELMENDRMITYNYIQQHPEHITNMFAEQYSLCICKISMHHIKNIDELFEYINTKYLLIREHDIRHPDHLDAVIMEHFIYGMFESDIVIINKDKMIQEFDEFRHKSSTNDNYRNREYWSGLANKRGLKSIWDNYHKVNKYYNYNRIYSEMFSTIYV